MCSKKAAHLGAKWFLSFLSYRLKKWIHTENQYEFHKDYSHFTEGTLHLSRIRNIH